MINAFPKAIQAIPVQYGGAEVMKVSVTMYYDRYRIWRDFNQYGPVLGDPTLGQNDLFQVQVNHQQLYSILIQVVLPDK